MDEPADALPSLSPSQFCRAKTSEAQPRYLLRVKMAAMGRVDEMVEEKSAWSPADLAGAWYGTTVVWACVSR